VARAPARKFETYFLGAGFSRAVGLPNTAELLHEVHSLAQWHGLKIDTELHDAYRYFYPEEATSFVPEAVDFFAVLRANSDVARGMPGAFEHPNLLGELRLAIARILCEGMRDCAIPEEGWSGVEGIVKPGHVIITSNWDVFVEHYAATRGIPLRLGGQPDESHVTLIKLHGSIDWTQRQHRSPGWPDADFAALRELQNLSGRRRITLSKEKILRIRAVENMNRSWQMIKARTREPMMITMSFGKTVEMEPIRTMWRDAYFALSATKHLRIIGYSLPEDDIEIRTLLRAGVARGTKTSRAAGATVTVLNPEPQVHIRVRTLVSRAMRSDYGAFSAT
jgi:SIR2-like domain